MSQEVSVTNRKRYVKLTKISHIENLFKVWFIQYFILFRVRFRQVSLFMHVTEEKFEDTNGVIRSCKSKKIKQHNDQKEKGQTDKQRSTKHYTENQ
jgi:hypothetical protein